MCRNPKRCGKCWKYGHVGLQCKQPMQARSNAAPAAHSTRPAREPRGEPGFDDLLTDGYPYGVPEMPEGRPHNVHCFIDRDEECHAEMDKLQRRGVVLMAENGMPWDLSCDNVASLAARTHLVTREEIRVSTLPNSCFLIVLPEGLAPETFIHATPLEAWEDGLSFQQWSPQHGASISIPEYKVLFSLHGIPPYLRREKEVIKAVSKFGVFLGTVENENPENLSSWWAVAGVDDLLYVPKFVTMHAGGIIHPVRVDPIKWKKTSLYSAGDFPPTPPTYKGPRPPYQSPTPSPPDTDEEVNLDDDEVVQVTRRTIREMCRGRDPQLLPNEIRQIAAPPSSQTGRAANPGGTHTMLQPGATEDPKGKSVARTQGSHSNNVTENQEERWSAPLTKGGLPFRKQNTEKLRRINPIRVQPMGDGPGQTTGKETQHTTQSEGATTGDRGSVRILPRGMQLGSSPQRSNATEHATVQPSNQALETEQARGASPERNVLSPTVPSTSRISSRRSREVGKKKVRTSSSSGSGDSSRSSNPFTSLADLRKSVRIKRKSNQAQSNVSAGPSKRQSVRALRLGRQNPKQRRNKKARHPTEATSCEFDPKGFYQVKVPYALCTDIAHLIGVSPEEVLCTVEEDNADRVGQMGGNAQQLGPNLQDSDEDEESEED